ncbi:hypothetical protein Trydic_g3584 [Trypoxylus dichotomus]
MKVELKYVARMCMKHMLRTHVFCVGALVKRDWVMLSHRCQGFLKLSKSPWALWGGSQMDCETGLRRGVKKWFANKKNGTGKIIIAQLDDPFEKRFVQTVDISKTKPKLRIKCAIYCSYRLVGHFPPIELENNMCNDKFEVYNTSLVKCKDKEDDKYFMCAKQTEKTKGYYNSPVISRGKKVIGFLEQGKKKQHVLYLVSTIDINGLIRQRINTAEVYNNKYSAFTERIFRRKPGYLETCAKKWRVCHPPLDPGASPVAEKRKHLKANKLDEVSSATPQTKRAESRFVVRDRPKVY